MTSPYNESHRERGLEIHLSRTEQSLTKKGAQRRGIEPRKWVQQALVHYDRWQDMWDGPTASADEQSAEVELFVALAENAPESLRGRWRHMHEVVRLNHAFWVWPTQSVEEFECGYEPTLPYINRAALAEAWPRLRAVVEEAMAAANGTTPTQRSR